jgi:hypothetical protein
MSSPNSKNMRCLDILQGIKDGVTDPASLVPNQRRLLIPFLMAEGQSTAEIAHLLKVTDRTIERYKKEIRQENALSQDPELANIIAGRLVNEAQICIQKIRKIERDNDCSPAAKIDAEHRCFQILCGLSERLQSLGFLPTATQKIEADLKHSAGHSLSLDEIESEAKRLQDIKKSMQIKKTKKVESRTLKRKEKNHGTGK